MTLQAPAQDVPISTGLASDEARRLLEEFGPNAVPDTALHPLRRALAKFWAPVPWMIIGISELVFCTAILAIGKYRMGLEIEALRTPAFVAVVFGNQATTYTNRERRRLGASRPSLWLVGSSVAGLLIASTLATWGIAMTPLSVFVVGGTLVVAAVFAGIMDFVKVPVFNRLRIA